MSDSQYYKDQPIDPEVLEPGAFEEAQKNQIDRGRKWVDITAEMLKGVHVIQFSTPIIIEKDNARGKRMR